MTVAQPAGEVREALGTVRAIIDAHLPAGWPELGYRVSRELLDPGLPLPVAVPCAACMAAGGRAVDAARCAAAWALLLLSARWFDDAQDQDREAALWREVGIGRATNLAAAALALSQDILCSGAHVPGAVRREFSATALTMAAGQDRDLSRGDATLAYHWETMRAKCASYGALAGRAGAMHATDDRELVDACGQYGEHVGMAIQILDDLDGAFFPDGQGDLWVGAPNLAVLYACAVGASESGELERLLRAPIRPTAEIRRVLDRTCARQFCVWAALKERAAALEALAPCPGREGIEALRAFADVCVSDIGELLDGEPCRR
jgi:hypothetical protein